MCLATGLYKVYIDQCEKKKTPMPYVQVQLQVRLQVRAAGGDQHKDCGARTVDVHTCPSRGMWR